VSRTRNPSKKGGDELHTRKLWVEGGEEVAYNREATEFPGIELILRIDTEITQAGAATVAESRYLIASLGGDEVSPKRLMDLVRGRWSVENGLHFIKDRWWDEDRQWNIRTGLTERLAMLRDPALTALRLIPGLPEDLPIRARADHLGRRLRKAVKFIGAVIQGLCNPPAPTPRALAFVQQPFYRRCELLRSRPIAGDPCSPFAARSRGPPWWGGRSKGPDDGVRTGTLSC